MSRVVSVARRIWQVASIPLLAIVLAFIVAALVIVVSSVFTPTGFEPLLPLHAYGSLLAGAFGSGTAIANTLVAAAPLILGFGRAYLPTSVVGLLHGAFQPHLDQMQHAPINDPARYRL